MDLTNVTASVVIDARAEKIWQLIGDGFAENMVFESGTVKSYFLDEKPGMVGALRRSVGTDGSIIDVEVVAFEPKKRVAWEIVDAEIPFLVAGVSSYTLRADGEKTVVVQDVGFEMGVPLMGMVAKGKFGELFIRNLSGLKHVAETGEAVSEENIDGLVDRYKDAVTL